MNHFWWRLQKLTCKFCLIAGGQNLWCWYWLSPQKLCTSTGILDFGLTHQWQRQTKGSYSWNRRSQNSSRTFTFFSLQKMKFRKKIPRDDDVRGQGRVPTITIHQSCICRVSIPWTRYYKTFTFWVEIDLSDGQFSERCDVDGSFFNSDAIPILFGKA